MIEQVEEKLLTMDDFMPLTGSLFQAEAGHNQWVALRLVEVAGLGSANLQNRGQGFVRRSFALQFQGATRQPLPQSIYRFDHPVLGEQHIFIVPIGVNPEGYLYEAIFN